MKSLIKKSFSLILVLCFMLVGLGLFGVTRVKADSSTITFAINAGDGSSASTSTACSTIVSSGSSNLSGNLVTATSVYYNGSNGLKLGTSGGGGTIKMNLSSCLNVTTIVVSAKRYNSTKSATLSVNGITAQSLTADFTNYTYTINDEISFVEFVSSKYCWIESFTINYTAADAPKLLCISVKTSPTKTTYIAGECFDPIGLVITKVFDGAPDEDLEYDGNEGNFTFSPSTSAFLTTVNETVTITVLGKSVDLDIVVNPLYLEGDYIITHDKNAMNNTISNSRLQYDDITSSISGSFVSTSISSIVWHIEKSGDFYSIYNIEEEKYLASTGASNKADLIEDGTDDKAKWTINLKGTKFDIVNFYNSENSANSYLRQNGTYGFACYADSTGTPLTLFRVCKIEFNGNESDGGTPNSSIYSSYGEDTLGLPECTFTKTSHLFDSWNTKDDGTGISYDANDVIVNLTSNITLYAQWEYLSSSATITFYKNADGVSESMDSQLVINKSLGCTLNKCSFTKYGYNFDGWATSPSGAVEYNDEDTIASLTGNMTLYAIWSKKTVDELLYGIETMASLYVDYERKSYDYNNLTSINMQYSGSTTTNMAASGNAGLVGLSSSKFEVTADKGGSSNFPGLNKEGTIRLYYHASGSNEITVTRIEGRITTITVDAKSSFDNYYIKVNGEIISGVDNTFTINGTSFTIGNGYTTSTQVHINKITINHEDKYVSSFGIAQEESKNKVAMKFGSCISNEMKDFLATYGSPVKFGIAYKIGDGFWKYKELDGARVASPLASAVDNGGDYFQFVMKLNHIPSSDFDTVITAKAYVEIAGVKYYMKEKAYSVNSMCSFYVEHQNDSGFESVLEHVGALTWLSTYSE